MHHLFTQLDYDALLALGQQRMAPAGGTRPAVWLLEKDGQRAVFKDYHACRGLFRRLVAPLLVWREVRALRVLKGMRGIPQLIQQPDRLSFVMTCLPATRLARERPESWPNPNWASLGDLVAEMHARGLAHCDLRSTSNILFDADGRAYLVDFVAHVQRGAAWNLPWHWIFQRFCHVDRTAICKLKQRVAPELLGEEERAQLGRSSLADNMARGLGKSLRRLTRWLTVGRG